MSDRLGGAADAKVEAVAGGRRVGILAGARLAARLQRLMQSWAYTPCMPERDAEVRHCAVLLVEAEVRAQALQQASGRPRLVFASGLDSACLTPQQLHIGEAPLGLMVGPFSDDTLQFMLRRVMGDAPTGLQTLYDDAGVLRREKMSHSAAKGSLLHRLQEDLRQRDLPESIRLRAAAVADEFFMNAFFDAPINDAGEHPFHAMPRALDVTLSAEQAVEFAWGVGRDAVVLVCADAFGSLTLTQCLAILRRAQSVRAAALRPGPGGAGIGLYLAQQQLDHLDIVLSPGACTQFAGTIALRRREGFKRASLAILLAQPSANAK